MGCICQTALNPDNLELITSNTNRRLLVRKSPSSKELHEKQKTTDKLTEFCDENQECDKTKQIKPLETEIHSHRITHKEHKGFRCNSIVMDNQQKSIYGLFLEYESDNLPTNQKRRSLYSKDSRRDTRKNSLELSEMGNNYPMVTEVNHKSRYQPKLALSVFSVK